LLLIPPFSLGSLENCAKTVPKLCQNLISATQTDASAQRLRDTTQTGKHRMKP
jgi:hypothetical protein